MITGAGGAIGRQLAVKFAREGCDLILWDVFQESNEETAKLCREYNVEVRTESLDITDRKSVFAAAETILNEFERIDILFNNAGIITDNPLGFLHGKDENKEKVVLVNVVAHFWTVKAFLPSMLQHRSGHIVSLASAAGVVGAPGLVDYCTSKFAAIGFMEALENEVTAQGYPEIKFTTICPTFVSSPMIENVNTMNKKLLIPEQVAEAAIEGIRRRRHVVFLPHKINLLMAAKGILPWNLYRSIVMNIKVDYA